MTIFCVSLGFGAISGRAPAALRTSVSTDSPSPLPALTMSSTCPSSLIRLTAASASGSTRSTVILTPGLWNAICRRYSRWNLLWSRQFMSNRLKESYNRTTRLFKRCTSIQHLIQEDFNAGNLIFSQIGTDLADSRSITFVVNK